MNKKQKQENTEELEKLKPDF
ncbi:MAG: hypothetical protein US19_C0032G0001, partial [Candidatus Daviesbacteria bacterium GW2011_GWB1_36_5]